MDSKARSCNVDTPTSEPSLERRLPSAGHAAAGPRLLPATGARKSAARALQTLSRAVEQTADAIFITDRTGTIEYVNPAFEALTGFSEQEAVGARPNLLRSGRHDAAFYAHLWSTILSGRVFRAVITNRRRDGSLYEEDQTITPVRDGRGKVTHFVSTGRDTTERVRTEDALRRLNNQLEVEATRIAGILHDEAGVFLTSAHLTLSELSRDATPAIKTRLRAIGRDIDRAGAQLRRVSHELHPGILDELGLLEAIHVVADAFIKRTGVRLTVDAALDRPCPPHTQPVLYRFVQEALTNMGKHAHASTATIVLRREHGCIRCSVADDGVGFETTATERERRGLGLILIRDRLEVVGGTLEIRSSPGQGTELCTIIPEGS